MIDEVYCKQDLFFKSKLYVAGPVPIVPILASTREYHENYLLLLAMILIIVPLAIGY